MSKSSFPNLSSNVPQSVGYIHCITVTLSKYLGLIEDGSFQRIHIVAQVGRGRAGDTGGGGYIRSRGAKTVITLTI